MRKRPIVKAFFCLMVSLFTFCSLNAAHLTPEQALQRLEKNTSMKKVSGIKPELCHTQRVDGKNCLYVFNKGDQGFVIASADDRMPPVLGYSDNGTFDYDKIPPALKWWMQQYALKVKYASIDEKTKMLVTRSSRQEIEPLIKTHWGQGYPYNELCPKKNGEKCSTGCIATAMAQIINYYHYPEYGWSDHGYEWNDDFLGESFEHWFDYNAMEYDSWAISQLIYSCGISVETEYDINHSRADETKIPFALKQFFNYDGGMHLIHREMVSSDEEWVDLIYSELQEGRPVIYGGRNNLGYEGNIYGGSAELTGHHFICDGFIEEENQWESEYSWPLFHINWGCEGKGDGYYNLDFYSNYLEPEFERIECNYNHSIIIGIQPALEQDKSLSSIYAIGGIHDVIMDYDENWNSCIRLSFDGGIFSYKPSNYWPEWDEPEEFMFYIKSVSENGEEYISERGTPIIFYPKDEKSLMRGYNEICPLYPPNLPEGEYYSSIIYQTQDGEMHDLMFRSNGPKYFLCRVPSPITNLPPNYEILWIKNKWTEYGSQFIPENKVISGLPTPFHYSFYCDSSYEGLVYVRVFKHADINSYEPIYPEENSCNRYDLMKEDVFMIRYSNFFDGSVELTYDLAPGEYELICYDQNGDRMTEPLPLIIEPEEGSYHLDLYTTLENPDSWNYIDSEHIFNIEGTYSNPMGMEGRIEYCVDNREWIPLTDFLSQGTPFQSTIYDWFDPTLKVHYINYRIVDVEGNITMVEPMKFPDINYIQLDSFEETVYNGEPHFQNVTSPDVESDGFIITEYYDNVNAGNACFFMEGVYPKTIGMRRCEFKILPAQIQGSISLAQTEFDFTGKDIYPAYELDGPITSLKKGEYNDYEIRYDDNRYAGTAYVRAQGRGNYTGSIWASFNINKIDCPDGWISYKIPDADITFDGEPHQAIGYSKDGMGKAILTYDCNGETSAEDPVNPGDYDVYLQYTEGRGVNEVPIRKIGQFSIYELNDEDWETLLALNEELSKSNDMDSIWYVPLTNTKASVGKLNKHGLNIEKGAIKTLNLSKKGLKGDLPLSAFRFKNLEELSLEGNQLTGKIDRLSTLLETEGTSISNLRKLLLNDNLIEGNAGVLASLPNLEWIAINDNCLSDIIPMIRRDINLIYKNQNIKEDVTFDLRNLNFETLDSSVPTIALYDHQNQRYTFEGRSIDLSDDKNWNIHMSFREGQMTKTSSTEDVFTGSQGELLDAEISPINCKARIALHFQPGDVDFNSYVNVLDIQTMINHIFERRIHFGYNDYRWFDPFNYTAANLFEDEIINVQDAVRLIDLIMEADPTDADYRRRVSKPLESTKTEAFAFIDNGNILLSSEKGIAAFDIIIEDPDVSLLSLPGFNMTKRVNDGKTRIIGYSLSGEILPEGIVRLGYSGAQDIRYAMLSDVNANELSVTLNEHTTSVSTIETSDFINIYDDYIILSIPAGSNVSWQITTINGVPLHKGIATASQEGILIPFKGEVGSVYIISANHGGKQIHKKIIKN